MLPISTILLVALSPTRTPSSPQGVRLQQRRAIITHALRGWILGCAASASGLLANEWKHARPEDGPLAPELQDPLTVQLRSPTGSAARLERARLEAAWQKLREEQKSGLIGAARTTEAFAVVLGARRAIDAAEVAVRAQQLPDIENIVTRDLLVSFESAATVLASSPVLSDDTRVTIGWQWGACGYRRCGAQADASQALNKLRSNLGMLTSLEAFFYLDVAKRAIDEVLLLGASEGLVARSALPRSEYLPPESLEEILAVDDETADGDPMSHKVLGTRIRAEKQYDLEERMLLEEAADATWDDESVDDTE